MKEITEDRRIAVVGAGIAGLACAAALVEGGQRVTLFDKSRRPGGRVATRRADGVSFDHGAQYATARGAGFRALLAGLEAEAAAAPWDVARRGDDLAWVGVPGMSAWPRRMAERLEAAGVSLVMDRHVAWLHSDGALRHLASQDARPGSTSETGGERTERFDAVLLALPAPQAGPLLATRGHDFTASLARVSIAPCWAVMLVFSAPIDGPPILRPATAGLSWAARGPSRPGAAAQPESWVLHASAAWSRAHLDDPAEAVIAALVADFRTATGSRVPVITQAAHRWRHALVETPLGAPCLWDKQARIGLCGDWCLGPRVEAAYESGVALARAVLAP